MNLTKKEISIILIVLLNVVVIAVTANDIATPESTYNPPIELEWINFDFTFASEQFYFDFPQSEQIDYYLVSFDITKFDEAFTVYYNNGSEYEITISPDNQFNVSVTQEAFYLLTDNYVPTDTTELYFSVYGVTQETQLLFQSSFIRLGKSDELFLHFDLPQGFPHPQDKLTANLEISIEKFIGDGSFYITEGVSSFIGGYFSIPLIEINKTGNFQTLVKNIQYNYIPIEFDNYYYGLDIENVWNVAGQFKLTIISHENTSFLIDLLMKLTNLIILVTIDGVAIIWLLFIHKK